MFQRLASTAATAAVAAAAVLSVTFAASDPAHAVFGEVCRDEVVVRGGWARSYRAAVQSAARAWEPVVARTHGRRFADFGYSGERQFTCEWNAAGTRYRCTVTARPCGVK